MPTGTRPAPTSPAWPTRSGGRPPRSPRSATATPFPVTGTGRIVAVALMLVGISLVGVITATIAAWFIDQTRQERHHRRDPHRTAGRSTWRSLRWPHRSGQRPVRCRLTDCKANPLCGSCRGALLAGMPAPGSHLAAAHDTEPAGVLVGHPKLVGLPVHICTGNAPAWLTRTCAPDRSPVWTIGAGRFCTLVRRSGLG